MDREPAVTDPAEPAQPPSAPFAVTLEDVSARYGCEEAPALDGVSLRLEAGRHMALVGAGGAGKTTVANLLLRFLDPVRGRVTLAGRDLRDYRQEDVRRARLWHWVRDLPDGTETLVGEQGRELCAGQRQRLVVARALLADAPVLVLDERSAPLDPPTAESLIADVVFAAGDRSVLLITHRPEGLELFDEVVDLTER